jgi:deferrochelatase/peroxidase EfeB
MTDPRCPVDIEFADVQGGILTAYGRQGFPFGRFGLLSVSDADKGRAFIESVRPRITTGARWLSEGIKAPIGRVEVRRPLVTVNLAFTVRGLRALGVPTRTLRGMPDEFMDGMVKRRAILGDDTTDNHSSGWDPVWQAEQGCEKVHILVMLNGAIRKDGTAVPQLDETCEWIAKLCRDNGGVELLSGHRGDDLLWQHLEALRDAQGAPCPKEHFGYTDGISDPVFQGQYAQGEEVERSVGFGATDGEGNWRPLAAGEFLLGWPDEAQEIPGSAMPLDFSRNGTFFAYRKLHQDIDAFKSWVEATAVKLQAVWKLATLKEARETLYAKMAGRWSDGVPLSVAATYADWLDFNQRCPPPADHRVRDTSERSKALVDFGYRDDPDGIRCPLGSHIRRANTRDMLDPRGSDENPASRMGSALNNRRRVLRRGLPYGKEGAANNEHGVIMLVVCASLQRQFEFVQQQWMNYGLDASSGNDTCPVIGNHAPGSKFTIPADPHAGNPPFIAPDMKQWVQTRGGDYFFVPSMTALRMIGMGVVDPT